MIIEKITVEITKEDNFFSFIIITDEFRKVVLVEDGKEQLFIEELKIIIKKYKNEL